VVYFTAVDDPDTTLRPRLVAAGADLSRVFIADGRPFRPQPPVLPKFEDVVLTIIDPFEVHTECGWDRQKFLSMLNDMAARNNMAVVALSRCDLDLFRLVERVNAILPDPFHPERRYLLSGPETIGVAFRIMETSVPKTGGLPCIQWEREWAGMPQVVVH
jgi:hypothetical protein